MPTTKVRRDEHGLYVRTDGHVFRPQLSRSSYPHQNNPDPTRFQEDWIVKVSHIGGSPLCRIATHSRDYSEVWNSHGQYFMAGHQRASAECWLPMEGTP
jgi:hypothetical protein